MMDDWRLRVRSRRCWLHHIDFLQAGMVIVELLREEKPCGGVGNVAFCSPPDLSLESHDQTIAFNQVSDGGMM